MDGLLEVLPSYSGSFLGPFLDEVSALQIRFIGFGIYGVEIRRTKALGGCEFQADFVPDRICNFALQLKNALHFAVILSRPDMALVTYLNKLRRNSYSSALTPRASLEDVVHTQFAADLVHRFARMFVTHRRGSRDDAELSRIKPAKLRDHLFC